jgi:hypothetical protein
MQILINAANAAVGVTAGEIVEPCGKFDISIALPNCHIRPGLINGHDHLHRNHYGRLGAPPYGNACEWASDIQRRFTAEIALGRQMLRSQALRFGAWKNLLAGVTHVMHHDAWESEFDANFPIHVIRIANADSPSMAPDLTWPMNGSSTEPFALHVSEGIDAQAAAEVHGLSSRGFLRPEFIAVHVVGPDCDGIEMLRASGCAMVWCPTSNRFLFGRSVPDPLIAAGIDIILGTDSLLTGDGDLLDELRFARGCISDERLMDAIGRVAARRFGICEPSLAVGASADLVVLRRPLLEATIGDVVLVMVGGKIRVLDPELLPQFRFAHGRILSWRGITRWISANPW